jgi:hypothetical protein
MIRLKILLHSLLSLPAVQEIQTHYLITLGVLGYLGLLFLVLKTFRYNKNDID